LPCSGEFSFRRAAARRILLALKPLTRSRLRRTIILPRRQLPADQRASLSDNPDLSSRLWILAGDANRAAPHSSPFGAPMDSSYTARSAWSTNLRSRLIDRQHESRHRRFDRYRHRAKRRTNRGSCAGKHYFLVDCGHCVLPLIVGPPDRDTKYLLDRVSYCRIDLNQLI
jgi:hypothetical protein